MEAEPAAPAAAPEPSAAATAAWWRAIEAESFPVENSYGMRVRFAYIASLLERTGARRVLDVGCGTGENLTLPLARAFPARTFVGLDEDEVSLASGRRAAAAAGAANVSFVPWRTLDEDARFDLIVASEVIEHVDEPGELLVALRGRLAPGGCLALTLPNGRGIFEMAALLEVTLNRSGIQGLLRPLARALRGGGTSPNAVDVEPQAVSPGTLAVSPHVNFFTRRALLDLVARAGFRVTDFRTRSLVCGYILDALVRPGVLSAWNVAIAERLPPGLASGWMLVLEPDHGSARTPGGVPYTRTTYGRWRRRLNLRRWGLPG